MEILGAAAIVAVALVVVAALIGRGRGTPADGSPPPKSASKDGAVLDDREAKLATLEERIRERAGELDRRARELDEHTRALEAERDQLALRRKEHEEALERISGLSAAQAKERLLKEVEEES